MRVSMLIFFLIYNYNFCNRNRGKIYNSLIQMGILLFYWESTDWISNTKSFCSSLTTRLKTPNGMPICLKFFVILVISLACFYQSGYL